MRSHFVAVCSNFGCIVVLSVPNVRTYGDMSTNPPLSSRHYRRRIIGLGALAFVVIFAVGAAIFIPVVQNDLVDRLGDRLATDGVDGVSISFSGQDGTLECDTPLADPDAVVERSESLHGVRDITLERSCTRSREPAPEPAETVAPTTAAPTTAAPTTEAPPTTEPEPEPELESILAIAGGDPLFGELSRLIEATGLDGADGLGGDGPFTLLAPTDAAFAAAEADVGSDALLRLTSDPDMLRTVLLHHALDGEIRSGDFEAGTLTMLDGSTVDVDPGAVDGITFRSGGSIARVENPETQLDIDASNGVIHAIDMLLLPEGLDLSDPNAVTTGVTFADGQITLTGTVQTEEQRQLFVAAAGSQVDPANVIDQLVVNPAMIVDQADADRLGVLVAAMPLNLVSGEASLVGAELSLTGTYLDDDTNTALLGVAGSLDASTELVPRPQADIDAAQALQDELNAFVLLNPVLFEPNSPAITPEANAILEQIAVRAQQLAGVEIAVIGYTDTDGDPGLNLALSEQRAASVRDALVALGVADASLTSEGRGVASPILDENGVEDKAASRRVEFAVTVA